MNTQRWQQVKDILDQALDLPEADLGGFLEGACDGDGELREEVDSLLLGRTEAEEFIERPVLRITFPEEEPEPEAEGTRFGAYEIGEVLGRGGMGTVYLARRADGAYQAQAALKILHRGMDTDEIVRRFESERQILASLRHPYIAELLDGGSTDDGRPFLVMEFIQGTPIDQFCDQKQWSLRPRLELFLRVCRAVEHAHRAMVVHRDLKPANILVLGDGTPKLLDFGIAKLLEPEIGTVALTQGAGPRIFTPGYASPEQLRGEAVGAASDTYSLGVLLYELLTGRRPYPVPDLTPERAGQTLEQLPIERPSTAVRRPYRRATGDAAGKAADTLAAEELSRRRAEEPRALQRQLAGDLDNILLKALRPEPGERYATVAELAGDIRAHLEDRPVLARQGTLRYRSGKFLQRHKLPMTILCGLLILLGYASWQRWSAHRERQRVEEQRARAAVEARKGAALEDFLTEFLTGADPEDDRWRNARLPEVLAYGAELLPERLSSEPEVKANLLSIMGRVYQKRDDLEAARPLLEQALEERIKIFGEDHEAVAYSRIHLGLLETEERNYQEAADLTERALQTLANPAAGTELRWTALAQNNLAATLQRRGDLEPAEALFREALEKKERYFGPGSDEVAIGLHNLASVLVDRGQEEEAVPLYRQSVQIRRRNRSDRTLVMTQTLANLGVLRTDLGALEEAEPLLREALATRRDLLDEGHSSIGIALNNLGLLLLAQKRYDEAEAAFGEEERIFRDAVGTESPYYAALLCNQARLDLALERWGPAEERTRRALEFYRGHSAEGWRIADANSLLGASLAATGHTAEAEPLLREAYETLESSRPVKSRQREEARQRLAAFYRSQGRPDRAEELLQGPSAQGTAQSELPPVAPVAALKNA